MSTVREDRAGVASPSANVSVGAFLSLVAALLVTALLGSLRVELPRVPGEPPQERALARANKVPRLMPVGSEQEGQLIPAVYAWDPTVRFVYYRHVSKWM